MSFSSKPLQNQAAELQYFRLLSVFYYLSDSQGLLFLALHHKKRACRDVKPKVFEFICPGLQISTSEISAATQMWWR